MSAYHYILLGPQCEDTYDHCDDYKIFCEDHANIRAECPHTCGFCGKILFGIMIII